MGNRFLLTVMSVAAAIVLLLILIAYQVNSPPTARPTEVANTSPTPIPTPTTQVNISLTSPPPLTGEPTSKQTDEPPPKPTKEPSPELTDEPTSKPTDTPMPESTEEPTSEPTDELTSEPTDTPTPKSTEEPTPEPSPTPEVVVKVDTLNLRSGPGIDYPVIGSFSKGTALNVVGRVAGNNGWIKVASTNSETEGWVSAAAEYVQINIEIEKIKLVDTPPLPTPTPIPIQEVVYQYENGPELSEPKHAVNFTKGETVRFTWKKFPLTKDQYYSIRVIHKDVPEEQACIHKQTQAPEIFLELKCPKGIYKWSVVVATKLPEGSEHEWRTDSKINQVWEFGIDEEHPEKPRTGGSSGGDTGGGGSVEGG